MVAGTSGVMAAGKAVTRTEVAALLKQQQLNKSGQVAQVSMGDKIGMTWNKAQQCAGSELLGRKMWIDMVRWGEQ